MTAKHTSDLNQCYACDRLLNDHEEAYCGPCQSRILREWDPTDAELARRDTNIQRGYQRLAAILAGATFAALLIVGLGASLTTDARAQSPRAHENAISRTIAGQTHAWEAPEPGW